MYKTALQYLKSNNLQELKKYLDKGFDTNMVDNKNRTIMHHAIIQKNIDAAKLIINLNIANKSLNYDNINSALKLLCNEYENVIKNTNTEDKKNNLDILTNLPNRDTFNDRLKYAFKRSSRKMHDVHVLLLDIDNFREINDTLGHNAGDILLKKVANRIEKCIRDSDTVARIGNDEFAILLEDVNKNTDSAIVANKLLNAISQSFEIEGGLIHITACIGIAIGTAENYNSESLFKHADIALQKAHEQGKGKFYFFTPELNEQVKNRMVLGNKLRVALKNSEFSIHYQPQVDLTTNKIIGFESLIRWNNKELGNISPSEFIPILEERDLIIPVSYWVAEQSIKQNKLWQELPNMQNVYISINLSAKEFRNSDIVDNLSRLLSKYNLEPNLLVVEITEGLFISDKKGTEEILSKLKKIGIRIALDDFGTGYCSLRYLKQFPIDIIKIDKAFIKDVLINTDDAAITTAIAALAKTLNLKVVAEGVEDAAIIEFLIKIGCNSYQGYFCSKPLLGDKIPELVKTWSAK